MSKITRIAAFTGNPNLETAISERLNYTGDYIDNNNLKLKNGSNPPVDWPCAIFRPEANMYGYDLRCEFDGTLDSKDACDDYNLPEGTRSAVYMGLTGEESEIKGFCTALINKSGLVCHMMTDDHKPVRTLTPNTDPMPDFMFMNLLFDEI